MGLMCCSRISRRLQKALEEYKRLVRVDIKDALHVLQLSQILAIEEQAVEDK